MRTPYNEKNAKFSDDAHEWAKLVIYPAIFNASYEDLLFESTLLGSSDKNNILDGEMAVDRIVRVTKNTFRGPMQFTVQERFRRINWAYCRDITITEWNNNSDLPSELYKITAGLFLYGYYDDKTGRFGEVVLVNTAALLYKLVLGEIRYDKRRNQKNQDFLVFNFDDLAKAGLIMWHIYRQDNKMPSPELKYCKPRMYKWGIG